MERRKEALLQQEGESEKERKMKDLLATQAEVEGKFASLAQIAALNTDLAKLNISVNDEYGMDTFTELRDSVRDVDFEEDVSLSSTTVEATTTARRSNFAA